VNILFYLSNIKTGHYISAIFAEFYI